jgi:hypothetical protein
MAWKIQHRFWTHMAKSLIVIEWILLLATNQRCAAHRTNIPLLLL